MLKNERELLSQENSFLKDEVGSFILNCWMAEVMFIMGPSST